MSFQEVKDQTEKSLSDNAMHHACEKTRFTLSQINTLVAVATQLEVKHSKYKTTSIYNLFCAIRRIFPEPQKYLYDLLVDSTPEASLEKLKADLTVHLSSLGQTLDPRSENTVYGDGAHLETAHKPSVPFSGPRSLQQSKGRNMTDATEAPTKEKAVKEAVDYHRAMAKNGTNFSARATHAGFKLYALGTNPRKADDEGFPGMQAVLDNQGITFEDWTDLGHGLNHLNWDINRKAVTTVAADEAFDFDAAKEAHGIAKQRAPKKKSPESAEGEGSNEGAEPAAEEGSDDSEE